MRFFTASRIGSAPKYLNVTAFSASTHCFTSGALRSSIQRYGSATFVPK